MYNTLYNLLMQGSYCKAGVLSASVLIVTMIFLSNANDLTIKLYRYKKSKVITVLFIVMLLIIFIIALLGPDLYRWAEGGHYAYIFPKSN